MTLSRKHSLSKEDVKYLTEYWLHFNVSLYQRVKNVRTNSMLTQYQMLLCTLRRIDETLKPHTMLSKKMPFGIPVIQMVYFPNQKELQLFWFSQRKNTVTQTTYAYVPPEIANALYILQEPSEIMKYVKGTILKKVEGVRNYPVKSRKQI